LANELIRIIGGEIRKVRKRKTILGAQDAGGDEIIRRRFHLGWVDRPNSAFRASEIVPVDESLQRSANKRAISQRVAVGGNQDVCRVIGVRDGKLVAAPRGSDEGSRGFRIRVQICLA
jgi:hypothetical protein